MAEEKAEPKRPPMEPLSEGLASLKERNEEIWQLAQQNLIVVSLFWEEGGTIQEALGKVSAEYVKMQIPDCIHPGVETCDRCQALVHLLDTELVETTFLCPGCV